MSLALGIVIWLQRLDDSGWFHRWLQLFLPRSRRQDDADGDGRKTQ